MQPSKGIRIPLTVLPTGLLWILFLAAGADAANEMNKLNNQCDFISNIYQNICHETQALAAFAFLVWIARK